MSPMTISMRRIFTMPSIFNILRKWRPSGAPPVPPAIPPGMRVYAIGDVHGCLAALQRLERVIEESAAAFPGEVAIIFLGDYIDRGPHVSAVLDRLSEGHFAGYPTRFLLGNHEDIMLRALQEPELISAWLRWGGMATLASYGVALPQGVPPIERDRLLASALYDALPPAHLDFLDRLELSATVGDYLFVHAGIRPRRPLEKQSRSDMLTIREPFLSNAHSLPLRVVHGHSVSFEPSILPHRIGIDTGAFATGRLSCVMLEDVGAEILHAGLDR